MREYKFFDGKEIKTFTNHCELDYVPVLLEEYPEGEENHMEELKEKYPNIDIHKRIDNTFNFKTRETKTKYRYYIKATATDIIEYTDINDYDPDFLNRELIIELKFKYIDSVGLAYIPISNNNCSLFDLIDFAIDMFIDEPSKYMNGAYKDEEGGYIELQLFDEGGWPSNPTIDPYDGEMCDLVKKFITGYRLVQKK